MRRLEPPRGTTARPQAARCITLSRISVDLDLQRMTPLGRAAVAAHQLDALERIVDADVIAAASEHARDEIRQRRIAQAAPDVRERGRTDPACRSQLPHLFTSINN